MLGRLALIGIVACILGLACYVYMGSSASSEISSKSVSTDVEKESEIEAADSDSRISVSADNCELKWSCASLASSTKLTAKC
jgi:hypothetical protein